MASNTGTNAETGGGSDRELLRRYVQQKSEAAFSQIIRRHSALVYATCKRETGDAETAQDVSQVVFLLLARKAPSLRRGEGLANWLFQTARFASKNALRQERRRRQQEAQEQARFEQRQTAATAAPLSNAWDSVEPHLNEALGRLKSADREAVLLRFFEGLSLAEVGAKLGIPENTARMRVTRALDKMRRHLDSQKVALGTLALAGLLTEGARAAPASLPSSDLTLGARSAHINHLMQGVVKAMKWKIASNVTIMVAVTTLVVFPLVAAAFKWGASAKNMKAAGTPVKAVAGQTLNVASLTNLQPLPTKVTTAFTLSKDTHAYYRVPLPQGTSFIVLDIRRSEGKQAAAAGTTASQTWEVRSNLSYFDTSGQPAKVMSYLDRKGLPGQASNASMSFQNGEHRLVSQLYVAKSSSVILDIHNQGVECAYWLTTLPGTTAVSTASPALHVPLFGSVIPQPTAVGQDETGRLTKNGYAYFTIPLAAGRYEASLEFRNASPEAANLNGEMMLDDDNGAMTGGMEKSVADLHVDLETSPPYRAVDAFTLAKGGVFLLSVSNDGSDPPDTRNDAVDFTARITPAGAAPPANP